MKSFRRGPKPAAVTDLVAYVMARCTAEDGCLLWPTERPVFRLNCCGHQSPREVLWKATGRPMRDGYVFARPRCDARCILPEHQAYVTRKSQMQRAAKAGRLSAGPAHAAITTVNARRRPTVVNSIEKAKAMRARYAELGDAAQVGREFGVKPNYAHAIVTGRAWREPSPWAGLA